MNASQGVSRQPLTSEQRARVASSIKLAYWLVYRLLKRDEIDPLPFDDAVQEACLGMIQAAKYYTEERGTWSNLACHAMARVVRQARLFGKYRNLPSPAEDGDGWPDRYRQDPVETASQREAASTVVALLGRLSDRQRAAIDLVYLQGESIPDVAEKLGVSKQRVCQLIDAAFCVMRSTLGVGKIQGRPKKPPTHSRSYYV